MSRGPSVPYRSFEPLRGAPVGLALAGTTLLERRGAGAPKATTYGTPVRAFVALANRARELGRRGFVEDAPRTGAIVSPSFADHEAIARYAGSIDEARSLPKQETTIARALERTRGPRASEMIATLTLLEWPVTFDVAALLGQLDRPDDALGEVLARELAGSRTSYPKELVRQSMIHGSAQSCTLALSALTRTKDPDAWLDVLIEGDPFFDRTHVPALTALAPKAPSKDIAKMAREIARDLGPAPRRKRR